MEFSNATPRNAQETLHKLQSIPDLTQRKLAAWDCLQLEKERQEKLRTLESALKEERIEIKARCLRAVGEPACLAALDDQTLKQRLRLIEQLPLRERHLKPNECLPERTPQAEEAQRQFGIPPEAYTRLHSYAQHEAELSLRQERQAIEQQYDLQIHHLVHSRGGAVAFQQPQASPSLSPKPGG